jgi:hypothetical protein
MNLRGLLLVLAPAVAHAQVAAQRDVPDRPREPVHVGFGGQLAYGMAYAKDMPDAWALRFEEDMYPILAEPRDVGPIIAVGIGADYWRAGHGTSGFSMPMEVKLGVRAFPIRATLGFGLDGVIIDQLHGDTGVGLMAPFASASAGLDIAHFTVLADARVTQRWQFGADDHTQWMITFGVGYTFETREAFDALR